jgi:hypothetical protein
MPDCQFATFAMVEPSSGYAPLQWQRAVGDCIVFRKDGMPMTREHVFVLWDFLNLLLDEFGDDAPRAVCDKRCTPAAFQRWLVRNERQVSGLSF